VAGPQRFHAALIQDVTVPTATGKGFKSLSRCASRSERLHQSLFLSFKVGATQSSVPQQAEE
jgi:hypothetical protein